MQREANQGLPQGSVFCLLVLNIRINDIFLLMIESGLCTYPNNPAIYSCNYEVKNVMIRLEQDATASYLIQKDEVLRNTSNPYVKKLVRSFILLLVFQSYWSQRN